MLTMLSSIGPSGLSIDTVSNAYIIPTLFNNAYDQGQMTANVFGFTFAPASQVSTPNGLITFGGADPSQFTGDVYFTYVASPLSVRVGRGMWPISRTCWLTRAHCW